MTEEQGSNPKGPDVPQENLETAGRFLLDRDEKAWIVEKGSVDVFLVTRKDGELEGARHHVTRVGTGELLLGIHIPAEANRALLAVASPDARVLRLSKPRLVEMAEVPEQRLALGRLLETWSGRLIEAARPGPTPKDFVELTPVQEVELEEQQSALTLSRTVWVKNLEGTFQFLGRPELPPSDGQHYLPLSPDEAWVTAGSKARLEVLDTEAFQNADPKWESLIFFHRQIIDLIEARVVRESEAILERAERRLENDQRRLDSAFRHLIEPLSERDEMVAAVETSNPHLMACQILGKKQGITFRAPKYAEGQTSRTPVEDIMRASGVRARRVVLAGRWWKMDAGPMLGILEEGKRPVSLVPSSPRSYVMIDPVTKQSQTVTEELARGFEGFAFSFYRPFPAIALDAKQLIQFGLFGSRGDITMIMVMGIAAGLLALVVPIATGIIIDSLIPGAQRSQLLQMTGFLVVIALATAMFELTRSFSLLRVEGKLDATIQAAVWDRLLALPVPFFREYSSGDLAMRGLGINMIRQTLTGSTLSSIMAGMFSIFSLALLFYYSWKLAILATILILLAFLFTTFAGYRQVFHQRQMADVRGRLSGTILQFINGISKLRVSGTEDRAFWFWAREFSKQKKMAVKARRVQNWVDVFNAVFPILATASIFYYMAYLLQKPEETPLTTGQFLAFLSAFSQFLGAMLGLSAAVISVLGIVPLYERAKPIFETLPEVMEGKVTPGELTGNLQIKHVYFRYREDAPIVLKDVSMDIKAGQFVAIVGPSGCGKSTLMRLILGFEEPNSGALYFDNQDQASIDVQALRRQIGVVLQNGRLLAGTIYQNIVGSSPLTIDDAWNAATMAGFDEDVRSMPMGMHTVLSEGGGGLSGGQRQRLLIARAIVNRPRIILFDEATSALDNHTQATVSRSLESLNATRVVIAHRLSTIINADKIFVMDAGEVAQEGTYEELMKVEGPFAELAKRQLA